jgi:cyclase
MLDVVRKVAEQIFIPFSVGGGNGSEDDMRAVLLAGAEKISVNSQAVRNPGIISAGARRFGNQAVVLGMDVLADPTMESGYRVVIDGGRVQTDRDALLWARQAVELGAGEIVLNSIDADGTKDGYDLEVTRLISSEVQVPVVASGGAGTPQHVVDVFVDGRADAALVASMVHYREYSISDIKRHMAKSNVPVRPAGL